MHWKHLKLLIFIFIVFFCFIKIKNTNADGTLIFNSNFDHEENDEWKQRDGIVTSIVFIEGSNGKCLKILGNQSSEYNFVMSPKFEIKPGQMYSFSAQLLVQTIQPIQAPYFKVEFGSAGRIKSTQYDLNKGGWQTLIGQFKCPENITTAFVALEKGNNEPVYIEAFVDEVKLKEKDSWIDPIFKPIIEFEIDHPRIFFNKEDLQNLNEKAKSQNSKLFYDKIAKQAENALTTITVDKNHPWRSREILNIIIPCAFMYQMTKEKKYAQRAKMEMLATDTWIDWVHPDHRSMASSDLSTGETCYAMGCGYDWIYETLTINEREEIKEIILQRGLLPYIETIREKRGWAGWRPSNWTAVVNGGVGIAAMAILEEDDAKVALGYARNDILRYVKSNETYSLGGGYFEGVSYWAYGTQYLMLFIEAIQKTLGTDDQLLDEERILKSAWFPIYFTAPDERAVNFSDCYLGEKYGAELAGLFASLSYKMKNIHDRHAFLWWSQRSKDPMWGMSVFNFIWRPDERAPNELPGLEKIKLFRDLNWAVLRSKPIFKPDIYLAFKSGDLGANHTHYDLNSFILIGYGERLTLDPGYGVKDTKEHSTVLVNGNGQKPGAKGEILRCGQGDGYQYILADASDSYGNSLTRFRRHVVLIGEGNVIVIVDELSANEPSAFQWMLHSEFPFTVDEINNTASLIGTNAVLHVKSLLPHQSLMKAHQWSNNALEISNLIKEKNLVFITALNISNDGNGFLDAYTEKINNELNIRITTRNKTEKLKFTANSKGEWSIFGVNDSEDGARVGALEKITGVTVEN